MTYRIGFVGTGDPSGEGFAMAYRHASGYERLDSCEIVACADIVEENAARFADEHDISERHVYADYETMLAAADPDVLSVCVPPTAHADIVTTAATAGDLVGIHCEKPMALTWGDAKRMAAVCAEESVRLTINHQLRFGRPYREAKRLLDDGTVGDLVRVEFQEETLYDNGTHSFDLVNYFTDQAAPEWMLAQVEYTEENTLFGAHNENQAIAQWRYENGVYGLASTGDGASYVDAAFRLVGTDGVVEIGDDGTLSYRQDGRGWETVDTGPDRRYRPDPGLVRQGATALAQKVSERVADRVAVATYTERAIAAVVAALDSGESSGLEAEYALDADELIFAAWESARRRGRVALPLDIEDNPLEAMVEAGAVGPDSESTAD